MTIGGNVIDYDGSTKALTENLITMKLIFNSVISAPGEKFMTIDMKKIYLKTYLKEKQCMFLPVDSTLEEIMMN